MDPTLDAFLCSWPADPWLLAGLLLTAGIYVRGWRRARMPFSRGAQRSAGHRPRSASAWRLNVNHLAAFLGGLTALYLALASPIEPFAALYLQAHMVQHLLLMMVVPPLLWLGAPFFPLLRGLPQPVRIYWVAPLLRCRWLRTLSERLTHPLTALVLFVTATWIWHAPPLYELALRSRGWHYVQHIAFLSAAMLFWYGIVRPYPSRPRWSLWLLLPCLILADLQNTALSALFTFSSRPIYAYYAEMPRPGGSVLDDQAAAGVIMWVPGTLAFLLPLFAIGLRLLFGVGQAFQPDSSVPRQAGKPDLHRIPLPLLRPSAAPFDLLRLPLVGRFLRWRHMRLALQLPLVLAAILMIYDGLCGPQVAPLNLAGVLPWIHWRGILILALLVAGNVFCLACPFQLPRTLARRWLPTCWAWPRRLRSKWLAVGLVGVFLWAYEAFSLWDSPWWTAWIAVAYFAAAFAIDGFFRGAAFCKYLCPIGQFNFVNSLVAPLEVNVRDAEVCTRCHTKDCLPACELKLYQPRKAGNLDCTFCLACVHACPHDNIGMAVNVPGRDLWRDPPRSGVGALARRPDLAALVLVLVFGAFANAAGMVGPVLAWRAALAGHEILVTAAFYVAALVVLPLVSVGAATMLSRRWGRLAASPLRVATRYTFALVPLGFGMWLAHYGFHLLTSFDTAIIALERFTAEHGWPQVAAPACSAACCRPVAPWLPRLEIVCLEVGMLLSLYGGWRISLARTSGAGRALAALLPWAVLMVLLWAVGVWIVLQPMQMRGTM
jgi:cytochrome c oxidase assembly factor CtaG